MEKLNTAVDPGRVKSGRIDNYLTTSECGDLFNFLYWANNRERDDSETNKTPILFLFAARNLLVHMNNI